MRLDFSGFDEATDFLNGLAAEAPESARHGVERGLNTVADEIRVELAQATPRITERQNNQYTQFSVGRQTVAATFPGLNMVGWIAVTGMEQGGSEERKRFASQVQADSHARKYAEALREQAGAAEITVTVTTGPEGAVGTLTAEREDDDATQRAFDASEEKAGQVAEEEIRKRLGL